MFAGTHDGYFWLEGQGDTVFDLLRSRPEIVAGKYVVIKVGYSGSLPPAERERYAGWTVGNGILISPRLASVDEIPEPQRPYFFEWLVFPQSDSAHEYAHLAHGGISPPSSLSVSLRDARSALQEPARRPHPGSARDRVERLRQAQQRFWDRMRQAAPESYLSAGRSFVFVTRDRHLHAAAASWIRTCEAAEPVRAARLLDTRDVAPGREIIHVSAAPNGDPIVLSAEQPLYVYELTEHAGRPRYARRYRDGPHRYRIHRQTGAHVSKLDLPET